MDDNMNEPMDHIQDIQDTFLDLQDNGIIFQANTAQEFCNLVKQAHSPAVKALLNAKSLSPGIHAVTVGEDLKILVQVQDDHSVAVFKIGSQLGKPQKE